MTGDRDRKLTMLVSEDERRRIRAACAIRGVTYSDVAREYLLRWAGVVLDALPAQMTEGELQGYDDEP